MGFLNILFALLTTLALVLLIVGLINPKWVKMKSRGKSFLVFFVAMIVFSILFGATVSEEDKAKQKVEAEKIQDVKEAEKAASEAASKATDTTPAITTDSTAALPNQVESVQEQSAPSLTGPQKNAARSAMQYLSFSGFSRDGLIQQLSSSAGDGYDRKDATVAVDSLDVDWNEQAVKSAHQYLDISGFSCNGLIEQLSSKAGDKYTKSQATYGAKQAGACS